jgi:hypothetical protein
MISKLLKRRCVLYLHLTQAEAIDAIASETGATASAIARRLIAKALAKPTTPTA